VISLELPIPADMLTVDFAKNLATGVSVSSVVMALLALRLVKSIVMKVLTTVLLLAVGLAFYFQRAELSDCAEKVEASASTGEAATCTFFGKDITIDLPDIIGN